MTTRKPRQPKLRASCDACGSAKVKCDRVLPECNRCISLEITCVYGVSRKMGKPSRKQKQTTNDSDAEMRSESHSASHSRNREGSMSTVSADLLMTPSSTLHHHNFLSPSQSIEGYSDSFTRSTNMLNSMSGIGSMASDFSNLGDLSCYRLDGPSPMDTDIDPTLFISSFDQSSFAAMTSVQDCPDSVCGFGPIDTATETSERGFASQEAFKEAYQILGSLSLEAVSSSSRVSVSKDQCMENATLTPGSNAETIPVSMTGTDATGIPLDHVLHRMRDASERLRQVMAKPSKRSADLAMLYASIISRVLTWYHQAIDPTPACGVKSASTGTGSGPTPPQDQGHNRGSIPRTSQSVPSLMSSPSQTPSSPPFSASSFTPNVMPVAISAGSFTINDSRVQATLKLQLIAAEVRRLASAVECFTSWIPHDQSLAQNMYGMGANNSLLHTLVTWIRGEHCRMVNIIQRKLADLNS